MNKTLVSEGRISKTTIDNYILMYAHAQFSTFIRNGVVVVISPFTWNLVLFNDHENVIRRSNDDGFDD